MAAMLRPAFAFLVLFATLASAQAPSVPGEIKGRWTYQTRSNIFNLSEIKVAADRTFTGKLWWFAGNVRCSIEGDPVSGKLTDGGITWDYVTKDPCNEPYTVELIRTARGWEGKSTGKKNNVVADVTAQ
jgi:hypothetical protein